MVELKINKKYFDAILSLKKPFELRHKAIPKGSIVKLNEIVDLKYTDTDQWIIKYGTKQTGRYIIFESGSCTPLIKNGNKYTINIDDNWNFIDIIGFNNNKAEGEFSLYYHNFYKKPVVELIDDYYGNSCILDYQWLDNFCWDYINEKQTYLIEIENIIEVK